MIGNTETGKWAPPPLLMIVMRLLHHLWAPSSWPACSPAGPFCALEASWAGESGCFAQLPAPLLLLLPPPTNVPDNLGLTFSGCQSLDWVGGGRGCGQTANICVEITSWRGGAEKWNLKLSNTHFCQTPAPVVRLSVNNKEIMPFPDASSAPLWPNLQHGDT